MFYFHRRVLTFYLKIITKLVVLCEQNGGTRGQDRCNSLFLKISGLHNINPNTILQASLAHAHNLKKSYQNTAQTVTLEITK